MRKINKPLFFLIVLLSISACNTVRGAGKDISKAGDKIEEAAK